MKPNDIAVFINRYHARTGVYPSRIGVSRDNFETLNQILSDVMGSELREPLEANEYSCNGVPIVIDGRCGPEGISILDDPLKVLESCFRLDPLSVDIPKSEL